MKKTLFATAALMTCGIASPALAADDNSPLTLSLEIGAEYDDNVTVDANDQTSQQGDAIATLDGEIGYRFNLTNDVSLNANYSLSQSWHEDLSNFDMQIHTPSLGLKAKMGGLDLGLNYLYSHTRLDDDSFLDIHSVRPSVGGLVTNKVYVIGAYEYQDKDFAGQTARDAKQHAGSVKAIYILGKGQTINAGYKLVKEDATAAEFDYWGHYFNIGLKTPLPLANIDATFRAKYRYYWRNYTGITPLIGEERSDNRHRLRTSLEVPFANSMTATLHYEFTHAISNLASVDYDSHVVGLRLGWEL
ncbi:MAG: hypothetical protein CMF31_02165 [Kordiimonas sp.]|nr:hypothetical protein [Kordiimonas sp.]|tara:strand:+ start:2407 stop:3315 length:909 start_codon:yes stop_codon:yes gene_type:complete